MGAGKGRKGSDQSTWDRLVCWLEKECPGFRCDVELREVPGWFRQFLPRFGEPLNGRCWTGTIRKTGYSGEISVSLYPRLIRRLARSCSNYRPRRY